MVIWDHEEPNISTTAQAPSARPTPHMHCSEERHLVAAGNIAAMFPYPTLPNTPVQNRSILPRDPREWTRDHVIAWLLLVTEHYQLAPVDVEKFHMNGRGLMYLNKDGFVRRAPSCGEKLFEDFRRRFARAIIEERNSKGQA
ncbi:protein C-ets-1-like [Ptychodera flava]|uniref:protein C-ets-1-like n=1 Tax=Ptychodera flava TaxID=63121 RepID=UPI003969F898